MNEGKTFQGLPSTLTTITSRSYPSYCSLRSLPCSANYATTSSVTLPTKSFNVSHKTSNSVQKMESMETTKGSKHTGRDDRATSEGVLDPRTRLMLFKLLSNGTLSKIDGCLSTGKEANVYYAEGKGKEEEPLAIKIYKTSILVFKDRERYVSGEHRYRKGYAKSNPRKMVTMWAEKEFRNYNRIYNAKIPTPKPILLKNHVLLLEFLGRDMWASPRLKDANLSEKRQRQAYIEMVLILRHMYQRANLVHGDFSEFNTLWHNNMVYVIDVSQSVESDHPSALDFLRKDIANTNDFFKKTLDVMSTRQLFEFVTSTIIGDTEQEESDALDKIMHDCEEEYERSKKATVEERLKLKQEADSAEAVFMSQFLPRSLNQVNEAELQRMADGEREDDYVKAVAMLTGNKEVVDKLGGGGVALQVGQVKAVKFQQANAKGEDGRKKHKDDEDYDDENGDGDDGGSLGSEYESDDEPRFVKVPMTPEQLEARKLAKRAERKKNKEEVKAAQSEKRTTKMKKKDKRKQISKSKGKKR